MKDIIIEKNPKKAKERFVDLMTARNEIIQDGKKELPKVNYVINQKADILHPSRIKVRIKEIIPEINQAKTLILEKTDGSLFPTFCSPSYITLFISWNQNIYHKPYFLISSSHSLKEYRITVSNVDSVTDMFLKKIKEQDEIFISSPMNSFLYHDVRDTVDKIFICDEGGITSFYGLISSFLEQKITGSIQLIYCCKTKDRILWKEQLDLWQKKFKNFLVTYLLSEEKREGYLFGEITEEVLLTHHYTGKTIFVSCEEVKYRTLNELFKKLDIPNKFIRVSMYKTQLANRLPIAHVLTIVKNGVRTTLPCYENETILESIEKNGQMILARCTVGVCGLCKSRLLEGEVKTEDSHVRKKDKELKYIHPCVSYPNSDITIEIP